MSELKVASCFEFEKVLSGKSNKLFYSKSDVDAVIADLKEKLKNSRNARKYWRKEYLIEYKECCNQKYKRCLAMARWCRSRACFYDTMREYGPYWSVKSDRAYRWYKWWFKTAIQFKDAK
jgi:hypothetical protein